MVGSQHRVTLRGTQASVSWGYRPVATITSWRVTRGDGAWHLTAQVSHADPVSLRQRPLLFSAPRRGGFWCWPIREMTVGTHLLTATLGNLEY